jgi:hypothetical protein
MDDAPLRERLRATLESVLGQNAIAAGSAMVHVVVANGVPSSDLALWLAEYFPQVEIDQQVDDGMYDGLSRVLRRSNADYFGWLGAGDTYEPTAFSIVLENSGTEDEPFWITGLMRGRRGDGAIVRSFLPFRYRRRFFEGGIHGTELPTIQQESTFWNSWLHKRIDFDQWATFRLAGDFYLWRSFCRHREPLIVEAAIGSFAWHGDNQSQNYADYLAEVRRVTRSPHVWERWAAKVEKGVWALHPALKARLARGHIRRYKWPTGPWIG